MTTSLQLASQTVTSRYEALLRASKGISSCRDPEQLFQIIAAELRSVLSFDHLDILVFKENSSEVLWHVSATGEPIPHKDIAVEETPSWWAYEHQEPLVIPDWEEETRFPALHEFLKTVNIRSTCGLPLTTAHRRLGVMRIGSAEPDAYSAEEVSFLSLVADHVALAIDDAMNFEASLHAQQDRKSVV